MKGSGDSFFLGGGCQRRSPLLSHPVPEYRIHPSSTFHLFPPVVWRARQVTGATSPLVAVFFFVLFFSFPCWAEVGLGPNGAKQHSPELMLLPPRHSSQPSCRGPKQAQQGQCPPDPPLRQHSEGASSPCSSHAQIGTSSSPVWEQAGDRVL